MRSLSKEDPLQATAHVTCDSDEVLRSRKNHTRSILWIMKIWLHFNLELDAVHNITLIRFYNCSRCTVMLDMNGVCKLFVSLKSNRVIDCVELISSDLLDRLWKSCSKAHISSLELIASNLKLPQHESGNDPHSIELLWSLLLGKQSSDVLRLNSNSTI